jgi:hypothetical protein
MTRFLPRLALAFASAACLICGFGSSANALPKANPTPSDSAPPWYFATPVEARCSQTDPPVAVRLDTQTYLTSDSPDYPATKRYACASIAKQHGLTAAVTVAAGFRPVQIPLSVQAVGKPPFVPQSITLGVRAAGFAPVTLQLNISAHGPP